MAQKLLFGPAQLTGAAATKYTGPAGKQALIRCFHFFNQDASARTVTLSIGADAAGTRILDQLSIPAKTGYDLWGYYVIGAAVVVQAFADTTLMVTLTITGDEDAV